jgi:hypothetical protein
MPRKLKVFRTPIGFHDAYVAAPSRKAALKAWGADADLFARGVAEEVTDPAAMEAALAEPGKVIRKVRGTVEEHFAALPPAAKRTTRQKPRDSGTREDQPERKAKPASAPKPRPSRDKLGAAEKAIEEANQAFADARRELQEREAQLARERRDLERAYERNAKKLEAARDKAEAEYREALAAWRR